MANIFDLPADVFLYILSYLVDIYDKIAFGLTCRMFGQICVDAKVFRKMDFSRHVISTTQRSAANTFFMDRQLTHHITELNISNLRVLNWQMDDHLEVFVISICPHLEALHVLNSGMSLQRLHCILKEASKLTALSWSLLDFTSEDTEFIVNSIDSSEGIGFSNIKHLRLEMNGLLSHLQIAKYLVLSCFRDLEELEICTWSMDQIYSTGRNVPLAEDLMIPGFPEPSDEIELQHLHSLVVSVGGPLSPEYQAKFSDFVVSVLSRKSSSRKWKKLWISPEISTGNVGQSLVLDCFDQDDFHSIEAIAIHPAWSANTVDKLKTFFERISDNTVRSLDLWLPDYRNITQVCDPISRVGGHYLKFLHLSVRSVNQIPAEQNVFIHTLFSNCMNITELDLIYCRFDKDICDPLSELKHLNKVRLNQCAISSKYNWTNAEISKPNLLTFVKNCQNVTHFEVHGCFILHMYISCYLTEDDLLALAKLRNLKSLGLYDVSGITEWTFLKNISEDCKFLTTLRIFSAHFENCHIPILMESAKFLKHFAISVGVSVLESEVFWNLLRLAKNLERICIKSHWGESLNIPVAMETLKSLPRLHVLHLHCFNVANEEDFHDEMIRMLKEKEYDCKLSFEIVTPNRGNTWINHETGYSLISNNALPLNIPELCDMTPVPDIPRL